MGPSLGVVEGWCLKKKKTMLALRLWSPRTRH